MAETQETDQRPKFLVRRTACNTCIYRDDSPLNIEKLENEIRDEYGAIVTYRICHEHETTCCRGFWNRHAKALASARLARMMGIVRFVDDGDDPQSKPEKMLSHEQETPMNESPIKESTQDG